MKLLLRPKARFPTKTESSLAPAEKANAAPSRAGSSANSLLFCVLFTLGCADIVSVPLAGGNFRIFYVVALGLIMVNWSRLRVDRDLALRSIVLLVFLTPSVVFSIDSSRSALYVVWTILTIVCTFGTFPMLAAGWSRVESRRAQLEIYDLLLNIYRLQIIVALTLYAAGIHERPQFLYYEPSYFSISLAIYCAIVAYRWRAGKSVFTDLVFASVYLITSASGAFFLVLFVTFLLNLSAFKPKYLIVALVAASTLLFLYVYSADDVNTLLIRGLLSREIDWYEVLLRGGNRLSRMIAARDIFLENQVKGVGYGTFELATKIFDIDDQSNNVEYLSSEGKPAINIYLELLATTGIIGFMGFALFFGRLFSWIFGTGRSSPLSKGVICMLAILTWESNFLRPYLWIALSLCWFESRYGLFSANTTRAGVGDST